MSIQKKILFMVLIAVQSYAWQGSYELTASQGQECPKLVSLGEERSSGKLSAISISGLSSVVSYPEFIKTENSTTQLSQIYSGEMTVISSVDETSAVKKTLTKGFVSGLPFKYESEIQLKLSPDSSSLQVTLNNDGMISNCVLKKK